MKQYSMRNPQLANWLGGIALGAVAMYLTDPVQGKRRRRLMQEKLRTVSSRTGNSFSQVMQGAGNRMSAVQSRTKSLMKAPVSDDTELQDRVRRAVHKLSRFPEEISIKAEQGCITLSGLVAAKERNRLVQKLRRMPGVHEVRDQLETKSAERGRWFRTGARQDTELEKGKAIVHRAARADATMMNAAWQRLPVGPLLAVAGLGYAIQRLGKSMSKRPRARFAASHANVINLQKSIEIQASPETVFNIWSKYDNFPQFMSHLVEVQSHGAEHSHWMMQGPAGVHHEWDVLMTKYMEPTMLAWKTEAGTPIEHNGSVRFESSHGGTRATVRVFYGPGIGGRSDNLRSLLGDDPERDLEADLERMKNFIEGKNFPHDMRQTASSSNQVLH